MRTEQKNQTLKTSLGLLGVWDFREKKSTQHQQLPTTIPYLHLKSISYSPDVGTLILREVPNCRLSQTIVNKPASHHLAKPLSFWNPILYQEYALIVVFSSIGFCLAQSYLRLGKKTKKKKPHLHSKVSYWLLVSLPPLSGCLILEPFCLLFSGSLGQSLVPNRWGE